MKTFEGKVTIVTGGSSGLGAAAALQFAREGAKVVIAARRNDKSEAVVRQIEELGTEGLFLQTDVSKRAEVEALVEGTLAKFGRLDCAVNNAGIVGPVQVPVAEIEEADWDAVMNTNLKAVWMCMKFQIPAMLKHGKGAIVNISSIYGSKASDVGHAPYCTSKHGVIGLSKTAAIDYAQQGIRVNVVSPGFAHSEMVDPAVEAFPDFMKAMVKPSFRSKPSRRRRRDSGDDHLAMLGCGKVRKRNGTCRRWGRNVAPLLMAASYAAGAVWREGRPNCDDAKSVWGELNLFPAEHLRRERRTDREDDNQRCDVANV